MNRSELQQILARGEDSRHQFKRDATNADSLAVELAAFANSGGGRLFLGVADDGSVAGLDGDGVRRLNQLLGNAASQHVRPPVHPATENVQADQDIVIVVDVPDGLSKPYLDRQGRIWVKQGADKRQVTSREEMQRMFQRSELVYADVVPVEGTSMESLDDKAFSAYTTRRYGQEDSFAAQTQDQAIAEPGARRCVHYGEMHRSQIMQLVSGTTVFHLYGRDMVSFTFRAPQVEEQTAIATILSDMDAEIEVLEQRRAKTAILKQGMMQELLTGRTRLISREDAKIAKEKL